jgi:signal peptidase I
VPYPLACYSYPDMDQRPIVPNEPTDDTPPITTDSSAAPKKHGNLREVFSTILVLLSALVIAGALIAFVFQSYEVDGPSMQTTLQNHDRLIVWKTPRTLARLTGHQYVPARGNVIVFVESGLSEFGQDDSKQLIKRVMALPGERVVVNNNVVTVYNKEHPNGFQPDKTLPYGKVIPDTTGNIDITLGKNQIFVCGDNRSNSLDSRSFGPVDLKNVVGKLVFRLLPLSHAEKF